MFKKLFNLGKITAFITFTKIFHNYYIHENFFKKQCYFLKIATFLEVYKIHIPEICYFENTVTLVKTFYKLLLLEHIVIQTATFRTYHITATFRTSYKF